MIYYTSSELSHRLQVALAKWKRWSREFLPPDPLGGLQSGFARQFSLREAFRVFLGGCLVADLKFSIPESRQILADLNGWLKKAGFYQLQPAGGTAAGFFRIYIVPQAPGRFGYTIRAVPREVETQAHTNGQAREIYTLAMAAGQPEPVACGDLETARCLGISALYRRFVAGLKR